MKEYLDKITNLLESMNVLKPSLSRDKRRNLRMLQRMTKRLERRFRSKIMNPRKERVLIAAYNSLEKAFNQF